MKQNRGLEKSDKLIVGLTSLCALLLLSWLIYDIAFLNPNLEGQIKIGKIYDSHNRVKRKFNRSLIWYPAQKDETVYENDWIFTGSQSIAKIRLDSGGEVIIEPDSLIILSRKNGVLQLDLQHGQLLANVKNKEIQVNIVKKDGTKQKVKNTTGAFAIKKVQTTENSADQDVVIEPLSLNVASQNNGLAPEQNSERVSDSPENPWSAQKFDELVKKYDKLQPDQVDALNSRFNELDSNQVDAINAKYQSMTPEQIDALRTRYEGLNTNEVALLKAQNNGLGPLEIDALRGNFAGLPDAKAQELQAYRDMLTTKDPTRSVAKGSSEKPASLSELVDRKYFEPEEGFSKLSKQGLSFRDFYAFNFVRFPGQSAEVKLDWLDPYEKWQSFETEVARDLDFKDILAKGSSEAPNFSFQTKQSDQVFWRVRGVDETNQKGNWSNPKQASIRITFRSNRPALQLSQDTFRYQIDRESMDRVRPDRSYPVPEDRPLTLSWQNEPLAAAYKVQISDKPDFSNILAEKISKVNELNLDNVYLGPSYFRVVPETAEGIVIADESKGRIFATVPAPEKSSMVTKDKDTHKVLSWDAIPYAKGYKVTYKTKKNSKKEFVKYVTDNELKLENKSNYLQWNVQVADPETKTEYGESSKTVDWYNAAKKLASVSGAESSTIQSAVVPVITKPEPRKTFISMNNSPLFIVMDWDYKAKAKNFIVEISKTANMESVVFKKKVRKRRLVVRRSFAPGVYYMRVRATSGKITKEAWSEVEVFRVLNRSGR